MAATTAKRKLVRGAPCRRPARKETSKVKVPCAYARCAHANRECKNVSTSLTLPVGEVNKQACRPMHPRCLHVRFCCQAHLNKCRCASEKDPELARGAREPLSAEQACHLFRVLVCECQKAWAAVAMLVQLCAGERVSATLAAQMGWLRNLHPGSGHDEPPQLAIPRVNKKTKARTIPIPDSLAAALHQWLYKKPLRADDRDSGFDEHQWPFPGQPLHAQACLFPGHLATYYECFNFGTSVQILLTNQLFSEAWTLHKAISEVPAPGPSNCQGVPTCVCCRKLPQ